MKTIPKFSLLVVLFLISSGTSFAASTDMPFHAGGGWGAPWRGKTDNSLPNLPGPYVGGNMGDDAEATSSNGTATDPNEVSQSDLASLSAMPDVNQPGDTSNMNMDNGDSGSNFYGGGG